MMPIHVAAAAIVDREGKVLISRRADHLHQGGLWEFPGGKLEAGETPGQALARELKEELGILPLESGPLIRIRHRYEDREVLLDFFRVSRYQGEPRGLEGQPLRWLSPWEMRAESFPAADRPVITALRLPERYLITGGDAFDSATFCARLKLALERGIRLVQLRAHRLSDEAYRELLSSALTLCGQAGALLLVNRPHGCVEWLGAADGIHLTAAQMMVLQTRPAGDGLIGASCHALAELDKAAALRLDYVLLSPVMPTRTHPGRAALGWSRFSDWAERVNLPVYALGGMQTEMLVRAKQAGGQGIAAIGAFWPD